MDVMTGRIVVGYDGSEQSCSAVDWAAAEAQRRGLPLTVLHVVDYLGMMPNAMGPSGWPAAFADQAAKVAGAGAERARDHAHGVEVVPVTQIGGAAGALIEASKDAALLVVGTHGRGQLSGALLGSVAFAVTGHARCPVIVVRGDAQRRTGPGRPVVVGFDGSTYAVAAVHYAADVAAETRAPLIVIAAYHPVSSLNPASAIYHGLARDNGRPDFDAIARQAALKLTAQALGLARERHPTLPATQRAIRGPVVDILTSAAERAGLLVVGSRGHGGFLGLMLGSVGHGVIHSSPCPVAVVHGDTPQSEQQPDPAFVVQPA
jgi:nucleotide-binding universal stress UspA family protein